MNPPDGGTSCRAQCANGERSRGSSEFTPGVTHLGFIRFDGRVASVDFVPPTAGVVDLYCVLDWTEVAGLRVQPAGAVPTLAVLEDLVAKSDPSGPSPSVDELALDGGEERFGHCVVLALTRSSDPQHNAVCASQDGEIPSRILPGFQSGNPGFNSAGMVAHARFAQPTFASRRVHTVVP